MPPLVMIRRCRLKSLLKARGKTQRWLASVLHVKYQRVNDWANDKAEMPIMIAKNCTRALELDSIDELFEWQEVSLSEWKGWIASRRR
jgi:DNA-binding XRE family transcriptional regulator